MSSRNSTDGSSSSGDVVLLLDSALSYLLTGLNTFYHFILPKWSLDDVPNPHEQFMELWNFTLQHAMFYNASMADFLLRHFDTNHDGHISAAELLMPPSGMRSGSMDERISSFSPPPSMIKFRTRSEIHPESLWQWFAREWPLMDWKVGVFFWHTFGGMLFLLAILSIVPGRLHGWSARILRWPVLGITYFLVIVELMVYLVIRAFIRIAEAMVARPKHRKLRTLMSQAKSYEEWQGYAKELDHSQRREVWLVNVTSGLVDPNTETPFKANCDVGGNYNWGFIKELIHDLKHARYKGDSLLALAVIQQCTRHNVGGIFSEELYSYSNTGEPKAIVTEFIEQVEITLHWITHEALKLAAAEQQAAEKKRLRRSSPPKNRKRAIGSSDASTANVTSNSSNDGGASENSDTPSQAAKEIVEYEAKLERRVRGENDKIWRSLLSAAMQILDNGNGNSSQDSVSNASTGPASPEEQQQKNINKKFSNSSDDEGAWTSMSSTADSTDSTGNNIKNKTTSKTKNKKMAPTISTTTIGKTKSSQLPSFHCERVLNFLKRARAAYGRTALCLSGGSMMGLYHFGVVKALLEANVLPHIISGTSAGSVVGAILCTRTDDELKHDLQPEALVKHLICFKRPWKERLKSLWYNGNLFDFDDWMDLIKWFSKGDTTFLEAYQRTGKIFCITLSSTSKKAPPVLLNYLSAPDVTIASAVVASAAVPGFIPPVRLQVKGTDGVVRPQGGDNNQTYWDGSIQQDLPVQGLAEMLNCQFFVACQCNPHIAPFFFNPKGGVGRPSRWSSGNQEDSWRGGFLLAALEMYLKNDMKAKLRFLRDVEASIGFTSTLLTQEFVGSTTIVPQLKFKQFFGLIEDPTLNDVHEYVQGGLVAAYEHLAMVKLHRRIARALEDCVGLLESSMRQSKNRNRRSRATKTKKGKNRGGGDAPIQGLTPDSFDAVVVKLRRQLQEDPYVDSPLESEDDVDDEDDDDADEYERLD